MKAFSLIEMELTLCTSSINCMMEKKLLNSLQSTDVLLKLIHEAKFYHLDGVTALLKSVPRENVVSYPCMQDQITHLFEYSADHGKHSSDFGGSIPSIKIT